MCNGSVCNQRTIDCLRADRFVFRKADDFGLSPEVTADLFDPLAIGAVDQDQQFAVAGQERTDHGFDNEGPAALHGDSGEGLAAVYDLDQRIANGPVDLDETLVARAIIVQRGLFYGWRCGERSGGEQPGIARGREGGPVGRRLRHGL